MKTLIAAFPSGKNPSLPSADASINDIMLVKSAIYKSVNSQSIDTNYFTDFLPKYRLSRGNIYSDLLQISGLISYQSITISERFYEIVKDRLYNLASIIPIEIVKGKQSLAYYILSFKTSNKEIIDFKHSIFTQTVTRTEKITLESCQPDTYFNNGRIVVSRLSINQQFGKPDIFVMNKPNRLIVSNGIAKELKSAGLTGFEFYNINVDEKGRLLLLDEDMGGLYFN